MEVDDNSTANFTVDDDFVPEWYQAYDCQAPYSRSDTDFVQDMNIFYDYMVSKYDLSEAMAEAAAIMDTRRW